MIFNEFIIEPFINALRTKRDRHAFCINDVFYTYEDLAISISKIREALNTVRSECKNIGLVANDDLETYASIFAIWMEGLTYVPLHPMQPIDRSVEILEQSEIFIILDSSNITLFEDYKVIMTQSIEFNSLCLEPKYAADSDLAYILFTSGSTGKPKGVTISRENVGAFIKSFFEVGFQIDENDRCLQAFDLTFDVSVQSFLVPLVKGACTYTIPHNQIKYSYVYGLLEDYKITFGAMAPSMIRYLRPYFDEINAPSMRYNILTAEASPLDLVDEWSKCIPNAEIYDFYGPTEATIYCTYYKYERNSNVKILNGNLSIGKAMNGLTALIIDEKNKILSKSEKGELCISGPQVTPGYWKNNEKNTSSLIYLNVQGKSERYYKTGDSCYFDEDGDILLAGRLDYQVKIQGYRIELSEIEYHARVYLNGANAVAIPFENTTGNTELVLFIESIELKIDDLTEYLKSKLPFYMIPTRLIKKELFPINNSGKVDRVKLKQEI